MTQDNNAIKKSGFSTAGLVVGIVGICISFIPIVNNASFILGILSVIFGIISLVKRASKGKAIVALTLGILSIVITVMLQTSWSKELDDVSNKLDTMSGENTEEVLKNVDINFGTFEVITDEYGYNETKLVVTITNTSDETKSFDLTIEAVSNDGTRIEIDYIYASDLSSNQSQEFEIFTYISSDKIPNMQNATFNVVEASMY